MPITRQDIDRMTPEEKQQFIQAAEQELTQRKTGIKTQVNQPSTLGGISNNILRGTQYKPLTGLAGGLLAGLKALPYAVADRPVPQEKEDEELTNFYLKEKIKRGLPLTESEQSDLDYKRSQIELNKKIMEGIDRGERIRAIDPATGEEVSIGTPGAIVERITPTRSGMRTERLPQPKEESFDDVLAKAVSGDISWEDVKGMFPSKVETIEELKSRYAPAVKSPAFKEGTGGLVSRTKSFFSPTMAEITPATRKVISNIKNDYDLKHFLDNVADYKDAGVDVKAILEYFGMNEEE